jgi:hypothetical protein
MGGYKCLCGFCRTRVSHKTSYCAKCPNKPPDYVNPAREQISAAQAKYRASDHGQADQAAYQAAYRPAYRASDHGKEVIATYQAAYRASDHGKEVIATGQAAYRASDHGQAYQAAYQPAYQAAYQPAYRADIAKELREKAEAWQKEHGNGREALDDKAARAEVSDRALFSPRQACCKT